MRADRDDRDSARKSETSLDVSSKHTFDVGIAASIAAHGDVQMHKPLAVENLRITNLYAVI
jgi:hypothetical protein